MLKLVVLRPVWALVLLASIALPSGARPLVVAIEGTELPRKLLHARLEIPVDAIAGSTSSGEIDLLVVSGERLVCKTVRFDGGPRFMVLVRDEEKRDLLADIFARLRKTAGKTPSG